MGRASRTKRERRKLLGHGRRPRCAQCGRPCQPRQFVNAGRADGGIEPVCVDCAEESFPGLREMLAELQ